ncbi:MAG: hypothetical protein LBL74_04560 [Bacteroidales bacterium]|jgi:hypothetical protein|nr:hypothetical protein [Bacteroidales bacterium]
MKKYTLIFFYLLLCIRFSYGQYKVTENYLIQNISACCSEIYHPFFGIYRIASSGDYYIASEENIMNFIKYDNIDYNKLILLLDVRDNYFKYSKTGENFRKMIFLGKYVGYFNEINDILTIDDTETYKIGDSIYAIRKIKYAYLDSIDMYAKEYKLEYEYGMDDIQIPDDADTISLMEAKDFYKVNYFQCFLFLMELQPTHKKIQKHLWKRRYEFMDLQPNR